jgi:hypothetical protein
VDDRASAVTKSIVLILEFSLRLCLMANRARGPSIR